MTPLTAGVRDGLGVLNMESADGFVITPSHNPPEDGSFKYIPPYRPDHETLALWGRGRQ